MRARGRHGTHSPFVYAFVEQVMRAPVKAGLPVQTYMPRKAFHLLYKTIKHLAPDTVYTASEWFSALQLIGEALSINVVVMPAGGLPQSTVAGALICMSGREDELNLLPELLPAKALKILLIRPHASKKRFVIWNRLATLPEVSVSLDYWHLGLLVKDPAFKAKQHFCLR